MNTNSHKTFEIMGILVTNFLPIGWQKAIRTDLLDLQHNRIRNNVEFIVESLVEPGRFEQYNTTRHTGFVMELKPWIEANKVFIKTPTTL